MKSIRSLSVFFFLLPSMFWCAEGDTPNVPRETGKPSADSTPITPSGVDDLPKLNLEDLVKTDLVFAPSKEEQRASEAPSSTTIITSREIKAQGYRTLDDLLRAVRGIYITDDRNYSYIGMRGLGNSVGYNSRILLLVDGHQINDNIYDQFYTRQDSIIDLQLVDRVEIIRGPSSSLFGSSAVLGTINLITRRGKSTDGLEFSAEGGSLETVKAGFLYGGHSESGWLWIFQGSAYDSGGNKTLYYPEYDDPSTNNGIAENVDGEQSQHLYLSIVKDDWALRAAYNNRVKYIPTGSFGTEFNNPNTHTVDQRFFTEVRYRNGDPETTAGELTGHASLDISDYEGFYDYTGIGINYDIGNGAWWGADLQWTMEPDQRNKLTLGAVFRDNFEQIQKNYDVAVYLDDSRQSIMGALYAQDEIKLFPHLLLNLGGRYDYYSDSGSHLTPRGALIWNPFQDTTLKLLTGSAFRAPTVFELYYSDGGISQEANPALKSESVDTFEVALEQGFLRNHRFTLSLFHYAGGNLIQQTQDPITGLAVYQNIGQASSNGAEGEYQFQEPGGILARISYSYQRAQDDSTGQLIVDTPLQLAKASLQVPVLGNDLTVSGEFQYSGASLNNDGPTTPEYAVINLKLYSQRLVFDNLEVNLAVYNLLDQRYGQPVSNGFRQETIPQDGRVLWARLVFKL